MLSLNNLRSIFTKIGGGAPVILVTASALLIVAAACGGGGDQAKERKPVPARANALADARVGELVEDQDLEGLVNQLISEAGLGTLEEVLDQRSEEFGFAALRPLWTHPDIGRSLTNLQIFGDLASKEYFGAVVEGRFSLEDLLSVIEGLEGPSQKELYRGHEILVAGGSALSSLDSGEILIGSPQAVREMIDVREGDPEALTGPVVDAIGGLRGDPIIGASFTSPSATVLEKTRESLSETLGVPLPTAVVSDNIQVASVALYRKDEDVSVSLSLTFCNGPLG